jgi:hypothetical protein
MPLWRKDTTTAMNPEYPEYPSQEIEDHSMLEVPIRIDTY